MSKLDVREAEGCEDASPKYPGFAATPEESTNKKHRRLGTQLDPTNAWEVGVPKHSELEPNHRLAARDGNAPQDSLLASRARILLASQVQGKTP
jgi:hypothetical protein